MLRPSPPVCAASGQRFASCRPLKSTQCQRRTRRSTVAHGKKEDIEHVFLTTAEHPIVEFLLHTNKFADALMEEDIADLRAREVRLAGLLPALEDRERLRRMRIAFANKKRAPWNVGHQWSEGTGRVGALSPCHAAPIAGRSAAFSPRSTLHVSRRVAGLVFAPMRAVAVLSWPCSLRLR